MRSRTVVELLVRVGKRNDEGSIRCCKLESVCSIGNQSGENVQNCAIPALIPNPDPT